MGNHNSRKVILRSLRSLCVRFAFALRSFCVRFAFVLRSFAFFCVLFTFAKNRFHCKGGNIVSEANNECPLLAAMPLPIEQLTRSKSPRVRVKVFSPEKERKTNAKKNAEKNAKKNAKKKAKRTQINLAPITRGSLYCQSSVWISR